MINTSYILKIALPIVASGGAIGISSYLLTKPSNSINSLEKEVEIENDKKDINFDIISNEFSENPEELEEWALKLDLMDEEEDENSIEIKDNDLMSEYIQKVAEKRKTIGLGFCYKLFGRELTSQSIDNPECEQLVKQYINGKENNKSHIWMRIDNRRKSNFRRVLSKYQLYSKNLSESESNTWISRNLSWKCNKNNSEEEKIIVTCESLRNS